MKALSLSSHKPQSPAPTDLPEPTSFIQGWIEVCLCLAIFGMVFAMVLPTLKSTTAPKPVDRAAAYLKAMAEVLERGYQQTQSYPQITRMPLPDLAALQGGERDSQTASTYLFELNSEPQAYTLTATAQNGLRCVLTLNQAHIRTATGPDCGKVAW